MIKKEIKIIAFALSITFLIGLYFFAKNESFWINIISTLIGALGALLIFYIGLNINKKQKDKTKDKKLKELYQRYKRELGENVTIAGDLINTKELSPYKFRTVIRDNTRGTASIVDLNLMEKLEHFYFEVDRIIQLLCKINFWEQGKTLNINAYSEEFQKEVNTAANRIRIHGTDCLGIIDNLLDEKDNA